MADYLFLSTCHLLGSTKDKDEKEEEAKEESKDEKRLIRKSKKKIIKI